MSSNIEGLRLGGIAEVASELGVSRQQVAKFREQPGFPAPIAQLAAGDFWDLDVIQRWSGSGLRRGPGRPAQGSRPVVLGRRFELIERIGGGGFAIVHSARDLLSNADRHVAVKVLQPAHALDPEIVARFQRELDVLSRLKHPHVVPVLDNGTDPELGLWYAMELATGNLSDIVLQRPGLAEIIAIMREICAGLAYIHDEGILHRDLKPANVLRTQHGTWALADFGLARDIAQASTRLTSTGAGWGSPYYIAPEQLNNTKQVDARADVFSAGKILQALVTGLAPVDDTVPAGALRPVILKAISPDRRHRYGSAEELLGALETTTAVPTGPWETPEEKANRLLPRLRGPVSIDNDAIAELRQWAETADLDDYDEMGHLARTLSILSPRTVRRWWDQDPRGFTLVFTAFAERLTGNFDFNDCDALADFAHRAVTSTKDSQILRTAVRGLTQLGERHNRWHVQDVVLGILQAVRSKEDAAAALEGLRDAGRAATEWTVTTTARRTLHPLIRAGLATFLGDEE